MTAKQIQIAKQQILEVELFECNMKDLGGGANNIVAQNQIRANHETIAEFEVKIKNLKNEIYPKIKYVQTHIFGHTPKSVTRIRGSFQ